MVHTYGAAKEHFCRMLNKAVQQGPANTQIVLPSFLLGYQPTLRYAWAGSTTHG
jgi:hypothetical protein